MKSVSARVPGSQKDLQKKSTSKFETQLSKGSKNEDDGESPDPVGNIEVLASEDNTSPERQVADTKTSEITHGKSAKKLPLNKRKSRRNVTGDPEAGKSGMSTARSGKFKKSVV